MHVFLDESGDIGYKFGKGSTELFLMVAACFANDAEMGQCDDNLARLRVDLGWTVNREFHFSDCSRDERRLFFEAAAQCQFAYFAVIVNKRMLASQDRPKSLYSDTAERLARMVIEGQQRRGIVFVFDNFGGPKTIQELRNRLKQQFNPRKRQRGRRSQPTIKEVRAKGSHAYSQLQVADMLCGAWNLREIQPNSEASAYLARVQHRMVKVERWP